MKIEGYHSDPFVVDWATQQSETRHKSAINSFTTGAPSSGRRTEPDSSGSACKNERAAAEGSC